MNKKNIVYVICGILLVLAISFGIFFLVKTTKSESTNETAKIIIEKYDENFKVEKTIEITDKSEIKEINKICNNPSLEQDDISSSLGIGSDVKVDLGDGRIFIIQLDLPENLNYCYYEDASTDTKLVIKMPDGLLEKVNNILETRSEQ